MLITADDHGGAGGGGVAPSREPSGHEPPPPQPPRVLLVEDEPATRAAMVRLLETLGASVTAAPTVRAAMDLLARERPPPECLILDLMLPDGSGVEVLRHVRDARLPVRVAVATGVSDDEVLRRVWALGPERLFPKPVDIPGLWAWVQGE